MEQNHRDPTLDSKNGAPALDARRTQAFIDFVLERWLIYYRRFVLKDPAPWTKDHTLATYKFTNIYRELDRVTKWIAVNWRVPHCDEPDVWFAMTLARLVNWPDTLEAVGYPVPWKPKAFIRSCAARVKAGAQVFTGAYMINQSIPGGKGLPKHEYVATLVLDPMWKTRAELRPRKGETLRSVFERLHGCKGFGSFMAAQVIADLKYTATLRDAEDWGSFAAPGPGSKRGLNIVCGREPEATWHEDTWHALLIELAAITNERLKGRVPSPLDAQDTQNCLCEFSKYHRGHSRTKFQEFR